MRIRCLVGLHPWNATCKCPACGKTRDASHDWATDCDRCHRCGQTRDASHDWTTDCERCRRCGSTRSNAHAWSGCKCAECRVIWDEGHSWDGCKCPRCGATRDEGHDWTKNCERCASCGKTQTEAHSWDGGCKCTRCGVTRNQNHTWDGCRCALCAWPRDQDHVWNGACTCAQCGRIFPSFRDAGEVNTSGIKRETEYLTHDWGQGYKACAKYGASGYAVFNAAIDHDDLTTVDFLLNLGLDPLKSFWTDGYVAPTSGPFSGYKRGEGPRVDSPLIYTMVQDKIDVFNLMRTHGLPLTRPTSFERKTLLILAVEWNAKKIAKNILGKCDLLSVRDQHGLTPLHHAANSRDDLELEELLITRGADVNAQSNDGWAPLHLAVVNWAEEFVALLLKNSADIWLKTARGETALDKAEREGNSAIKQLIHKYIK